MYFPREAGPKGGALIPAVFLSLSLLTCSWVGISDRTIYTLASKPREEQRARRESHPAPDALAGEGRTYGFLCVHPQAGQVIAKEGQLVFGASCQGDIGTAGPRLKTHEAARNKLAALFHRPWLDGE